MKRVIVKRKGQIVQEFKTAKEALAYVDFTCRHSKVYNQWDFEVTEEVL